MSKEVEASITERHPVCFDYRPIFSFNTKHRQLPFSPRLPPDPEAASETFMSFVRARAKVAHLKPLIPDIGMKSFGEEATESFWRAYRRHSCTFGTGLSETYGDRPVLRDVLRLEHETGERVHGPTEMRISWKFVDLKPRVYFARSGEVARASLFVQEIFNTIIDEFPEVHRRNRFSDIECMFVTEKESCIVYDYTAFTSNLDEIKCFVHALANFFLGTEITVIDPGYGPVVLDVGEYLHEYNRVCNSFAEFSLDRFQDYFFSGIVRHTCGMLGVPGNIFSCTLFHGIHLRMLAGLRRSRCVGDDARFYYQWLRNPQDRRYLIEELLGSIGIVALEKSRFYDPDDEENGTGPWNYVKRPLA